MRLGNLGVGTSLSGIFLQASFADAVLEEGAKGRQLTGDGGLLQAVVVQVADELANSSVRDAVEGRRIKARGREIG